MAGDRYELTGKTVLITGASRGIGAEAARQLSHRGARVSLVGLEPELLAEVAGGLREAAWFEADVTDWAQVEQAVAGTVERFGGIDVAVANAGIGLIGAIETIEPALFERTIDVNLLGVWRTVRATLPHVSERSGYVLVVASLAAALHTPLMAHYAASKAGAEAFANVLRTEVDHLGVDVGVAYFGFIETDMVRAAMEHPAVAELRGQLEGPIRKGHPVEAAGEAIVRGIERRARRVVYPPWARSFLLARGVLQRLTDARLRRSGAVEALRRARREATGSAAREAGRVR
jgi:NAD(P)-dependent dehydrogenase (short-subunit alcohol dehydrogenase family)